MRRSMMRPTRRNPYNPTVAQALHNWLTSNGLLHEASTPSAPAAAPAPKPAAAAPAAIGFPPTFFPTNVTVEQLKALEKKSVTGKGAVIVLYPHDPDEGPTAWFHYSTGDWSRVEGPKDEDPGVYMESYLTEEEFAEKVASSAAAYYAGTSPFDSDDSGPLIKAAPEFIGTAAAPVAAPAPVAGMDLTLLAALQALVAYIKDDATKIGMANAIFSRVVKNSYDHFSSAYPSDFDGYGTPTGRTTFLKKLKELGVMKDYGYSGKLNVTATSPLGEAVAAAWTKDGYTALLATLKASGMKAAKAAKPKKPAASAAAEAAATVGTLGIPAKPTVKSQKVTSIEDSIKILGPLIKEAASKVTSILTESDAGGINMRMKDDIDSSVSIVGATANTVTLVYYKDSFVKAEKTVSVAVPDTAGTIASTIAQAMVYFLVYSHESKGKVTKEPPPEPEPPTVVDGKPLILGATITKASELSALPAETLLSSANAVGQAPVATPTGTILPATVRFLPMPKWDTYYQPLPQSAKTLATEGVVIPAPQAPGWPAVRIAPTLPVYTSLPIGTLIRTDFSGGSNYAVRTLAGSYEKLNSSTGAVSSTPRTPETLVKDADGMMSKGTPVEVYVVKRGKGMVEPAATYLEWVGGKRADSAEAHAQEEAAKVEMLAEVLGIDPRVAALFTPKVLQAMIAQTGIPYMGSTLIPPVPATAKSPLLKKNPGILGGFRSNPERYRDVVRQVLRNPRPSLRDLQDAELLEAAGLPLHGALSRRRNPDGALAEATDTESGIIKGIADALKAALGSAAKPSGSTTVGSSMDAKLSSMYKSGKTSGNPTGYPRPEGSGSLGQYLRYLVAARAIGLWKNYIDPGEREVTRGLSFSSTQANDPSQSVRVNEDGLAQIEVMKSAGVLSTPVAPFDAMKAWLTKQASGSGWFRADVGQPWQASSALTPPSYYEGKASASGSSTDGSSIQHWNTWQRAEGGDGWKGKLPYPSWAAEPWANVEGFSVDYHDPTFQKFTASEWSAPLGGYSGVGSFLLRANTRDPRFVLLPGSTISGGPMKKFEGEGAIVFVTVDEKPLKAEVVSTGGYGNFHLTLEQLAAWIRARPAYPTGPKPVGPAAGIAIHRNPAPTATRVNVREVHALLFPRAKWGPGAVRAWLTRHGMEGLNVEAAGGNWRVPIYAPDAFHPGSIRQRNVGNGIFALVGRPL